MKLELWFPTPIWYDKFNDIREQEYNDAINYCNFLSTRNSGKKISNIGGWQSEDFFYDDVLGTPLQVFIDQVKPAICKALFDLGVTHKLKLNNIWININDKNDTNSPHDHPSSSISGVFYLTNKNSSIIFHRNRDVSDVHLSWLNSNRNTNLSYQTAKYIPERGHCLIFPSWLIHSVEPNTSTEKRISIAFNVATL